MRGKIVILVSCVLFFAACQQKAAETKTQNINRTQNTAPIPPSSAATPDKSHIKIANGKGIVTKINLELVSVEIDHEEIKGVMPPMKMEFYVVEKRELEILKVGDKVDFVLEDNNGQEKIISIKKEK